MTRHDGEVVSARVVDSRLVDDPSEANVGAQRRPEQAAEMARGQFRQALLAEIELIDIRCAESNA